MRECIVVFLLALTCQARADTTITYQGQLADSGQPFTGTVEMEFQLFDEATGGVAVSGAVVESVGVENGLFQVDLDFGDVFDGSGRWLEIHVEGVALLPRQAIRAAPVAVFALAGNQGPPGDSHWQISGDSTFYDVGNVGIGTDTPAVPLHVQGSLVSGNSTNTASIFNNFVGGGRLNKAAQSNSFVGGGAQNEASASHSFVGGGFRNKATGGDSFVGGGTGNLAGGEESFVGGGKDNEASGLVAIVSGGAENIASGTSSSVSGGFSNQATANNSSVSGGGGNIAGGPASFVGGGALNEASGQSSFVAAGRENEASGHQSFAAGRGAKALHVRTFVWSGDQGISTTGDQQFLVDAPGGVGIGTNQPAEGGMTIAGRLQVGELSTATSINLCRSPISGGGAFLAFCSSSERYKDRIADLEGARELVEQLRAVSFRWKRSGEEDIGLIAEEVAAIDPRLATYDEDGEVQGVKYRHLSAVLIKAFQEQNVRNQAESAALRARLSQSERTILALQAELGTQRVQTAERLAALEALLLNGAKLTAVSEPVIE